MYGTSSDTPIMELRAKHKMAGEKKETGLV